MSVRYDFGSKPPSIVRFETSDVNLNLSALPDKCILYRSGTSLQGIQNAQINTDGSLTLGNALISGNTITITNLQVDNLYPATSGGVVTLNGAPLSAQGSSDHFTVTTDATKTSYTIRSYASLSTLDATPTTIVSFPTVFSAAGVYYCLFVVIGVNETTGDQSVGFRVNAKYHNALDGTKTIVYDTITKTTDVTMSSTDMSVSVSGVTVTGLASTNIKWTCSSDVTALQF